MENRGFEEEQPRGDVPCHGARALDATPSVYSDSHLYEDISVNEATDVAFDSNFFLPSEKPNAVVRVAQNANSSAPRGSYDSADFVSREASRRSSVDEDADPPHAFQRNLTLPFRRGTCPDAAGTASSSVRVTSREKSVSENRADASPDSASLQDATLERVDVETVALHSRPDSRPARRRRKKDCKHCRVKTDASRERSNLNESETTLDARNLSLSESGAALNLQSVSLSENEARIRNSAVEETAERRSPACESNAEAMIARGFGMLPVCRASGKAAARTNPATVFLLSESARSPAQRSQPGHLVGRGVQDGFGHFVQHGAAHNIGQNIEHGACQNLGHGVGCEGEAKKTGPEKKEPVATAKNRPGMRVNSIYSQDRWYAKEAPIFFTDVEKEHGPFQNRVNLRRSVRGEPPPHPARLHKHRHGWTLHLARPLESPGCTRSLVFLLIVVLSLLGVGAAALYIVFEPEKLQIIQQYLRSSTSNSTRHAHAETLAPSTETDERNDTTTISLTNGTLLSNDSTAFFADSTAGLRTEVASTSSGNVTRYCDDCLTGEVCVALVDEEVPTCRLGVDHEDPTGCAGHCLINKQRCHRLDVDAFRCVEVEHYCLDDEWTCSNTLCIPLDKHCDGHMNCYDHSDEYNCACNLETHFQCGNETSCLPLEKRCDGKIDCWDAADEINCTLACPLENEFTCSNGQCILKARFCDGLPDCVDGSDEPHGCQGRCNKQEFTCQNSRCIAKGVKCNGIDDCGDGTDERHCKERFT